MVDTAGIKKRGRIYENVEKNGTLEIYKPNNSMLVLTTCNQVDKTKQIVIYAKLIAQKNTT